MKTLKWGLLYTAAFLAAFVGSALLKMNSDPTHGKYNTRWDETVGKVYTDLPYGEGAANKFDLYVPADKSQGIKQLMAGAGIMLLGTTLIPQLATLFS